MLRFHHGLLARSPALLALSLLPLSSVIAVMPGCKANDDALSTDALELIPADIQGIYGRTPQDAPGMTVSATGLSLGGGGDMQLTIHQGKMEGSTVRIERATLQWAKLDPKTCNGTLSRQGDQLLMTLYDSNKDGDKCESTLDAKWLRWEPLDELPELIRGRYGSLLVEQKGMRLDVEWVHAQMQVGTLRELPGSNDERAELLITAAKVVSADLDEQPQTFECTGTMTLAEGRMDTDFWVPPNLVPVPGSDEAKDPVRQAELALNEDACDRWDGHAFKWDVSLDKLPKQPIKFGELSLAITPQQVVLDSPHLRCEQELWRTETVDSQAGWAGVQVGGERMTLSRAEPKHVSDQCKLKLRIWCELQMGQDPAAIDPAAEPAEHIAACIDDAHHQLCPESITVRAISDVRYKVHVEPPNFNAIACVDPTGEFAL
jgi:hypothetical protein